MENENFRYEAFVSYRHRELDTAAAKAVHRQLETFRIPASIRAKSGKNRIGKVFRDQDELPLMADLSDGIRRALEQSLWLIVICSPDLPLSKWCMAEIDYFLELGRRDRILTILIAGEPDESFPAQLRFVPDESGEVTEREPLAADVRAPSVRAMLRKLRTEKLRLLAPMLGVGFDDLRRRARERFFRFVISLSLAAAVFFAVFGGFAFSQAMIIARQNETLAAQKAKVYANFSQEQLGRGNRAGAALLALEAMPQNMKGAMAPEAKNALYAVAYRAYDQWKPIAQTPGGAELVPAPDGKTFAATDAEFTRVYDAATFRLIYEHPGATTTVKAFESGGAGGAQVKRAVYNKAGDVVFLPGGTPVFVDVRTGAVVKEGYFTDAGELADFGLSRYECVNPQSKDRYIIDLGSGETIFAAPTQHGASKNLVSPDGAYYVVATYAGLEVFDIKQREPIATLPCEGVHVVQGYTFFSPDSRFLALTRETLERIPVAAFEEPRTTYAIQILEIPSCRVVYENTFLGYPITAGNAASRALPNYYNGFDSDVPAHLFAGDGSKLLLPVGTEEFGVFDLAREQMLFTRKESLRFASFSPSGEQVLTIGQSGNTWKLLHAAGGEETARFHDPDAVFLRGFVLPDNASVLMAGRAEDADFCGLYELRETGDAGNADMSAYFADESGRYIQPAASGQNAAVAVANGFGGESALALENSEAYTDAALFAAAGDTVVGLSDAGTESVLTSWDADTGKRLAEHFPMPENCWVSTNYFSPSFFLSPDGARVAALYQEAGVTAGGFRTFDARTGEVLAERTFPLGDATVLFDRNVTKLLYVYDNAVVVFDALTGKELFTLDDYPEGQLALGTWSGHKAAVSDDGALVAVTHSKKDTLEIIDAETGERLHEVPLGGQATTAPCFSHDGGRVAVGAGKYLFCADTNDGRILFSVYDEAGFKDDFSYSEDDLYLLGADIRDAETGEVACSVSLAPQPAWEITGEAGVKIPMGRAHAVYLPSADEALADLRAHIREYAFTRSDRLRFALD